MFVIFVKLLLNIQMMWMIFMEILMNTIQKKHKILIIFDDMIADMVSNKKPYAIVTDLFI